MSRTIRKAEAIITFSETKPKDLSLSLNRVDILRQIRASERRNGHRIPKRHRKLKRWLISLSNLMMTPIHDDINQKIPNSLREPAFGTFKEIR